MLACLSDAGCRALVVVLVGMDVDVREQSWWWESGVDARERVLERIEGPPPEIEKVDAVVIGGGLTGVSTAYGVLCIDPSARVVIVEAGEIGCGASSRNGGHLWPSFEPNLGQSLESVDVEEAREELQDAFDYDFAGILDVAAFAERHGVGEEIQLALHGVAVDVVPSPGDYADMCKDPLPLLEALAAHSEAGKRMGSRIEGRERGGDVLGTSRVASLFGDGSPGFGGCMCEPGCGRIHPMRLVYAILEAALDAVGEGGALWVAEGVMATGREEVEGGGVRVTTDEGRVYDGAACVVAVNGYNLVPQLLPEWLRGEDVLDVPHELALSVQTSREPSLVSMLRSEVVGDIVDGPDVPLLFAFPGDVYGRMDGRTLVVGSSVDFYVKDEVPDEVAEELVSIARAVVEPDAALELPASGWTGRLAYTSDMRPLVGPVGESTYVAGGYNGNGVTKGLRSGYAAAAFVCGGGGGEVPEFMRVVVPKAFDPRRFEPSSPVA